ncbi:dTDP-4-dehydrorhamnose 3,5-epimerase [Candidatus Sumerlaeota bacterium]|nr:dTDP-4-dehydrorhamnose 3,5-epimerase [Candidatus Sumerlaeota bacterium]
MKLERCGIDGLYIVIPTVFRDPRGLFFESYNLDEFTRLGLNTVWRQDNLAVSSRNVLRGLHFQRGKGQAKLVSCVHGRIWDVAVDLRTDSSSFGQWHGLELIAENNLMFYIPAGFAHGYVVLSDTAKVTYKCSTVYDPELEDQIKWDDPEIGVEWPAADPIISERDQKAQSFRLYQDSMASR